jgi:hypothetical protein
VGKKIKHRCLKCLVSFKLYFVSVVTYKVRKVRIWQISFEIIDNNVSIRRLEPDEYFYQTISFGAKVKCSGNWLISYEDASSTRNWLERIVMIGFRQ